MIKIIFLSGVVLLSSCSVFDAITTPPEPDTVVCKTQAPVLPMPNEDGNVVLDPEDRAKLLIYIEELEYCIEQQS